MDCGRCGCDNRAGAKSCNECGAPLLLRCASCGTENPPDAKFCNECGAALTGKTRGEPEKWGREQKRKRSRGQPSLQTLDARHQTLDASREAREGERRQLTVMFCDLVGSTALSTQLDPEELHEVIQAYRETCAIVIRRFEGYLAKYLGDGLLVYFGYPLAHEDDAQRAVRAGLDILAELPHLNARLQPTVGAHSRARSCAPLPSLGIPATLHDALMARLDRLATAKEIAQLGATLGREFSYELLQAISPLDEATLQKGLSQLVEAELLYQRGLPPQARYIFKHALIQDA